MRKPCNDELPFGIIINQVEDSVEHADAGGKLLANEKIFSKAYKLLIKSGLYPLGYRQCESEHVAQKKLGKPKGPLRKRSPTIEHPKIPRKCRWVAPRKPNPKNLSVLRNFPEEHGKISPRYC